MGNSACPPFLLQPTFQPISIGPNHSIINTELLGTVNPPRGTEQFKDTQTEMDY